MSFSQIQGITRGGKSVALLLNEDGSISTVSNYKYRFIIEPVTGQIIAETREQNSVVERQNWVYDASGVFIGVDAWAVV